MGRGASYYGLTLSQLCRLAACERKESECEEEVFTRVDVSLVLEVEVTQAGRFIREMVDLGWMYCVYKPEKRGLKGERSTYRMTPDWREVAGRLRREGVLPDLCEREGCDRRALPFRFRGRFWCEEHLRDVHCSGCKRCDQDGVCPKMQPQEVTGDDSDA